MTAYYNEIEPYAAQWIRNLIAAGHIAPGEVDTRSIVDVQPEDLIGFTQAHFFAGVAGWSLALRLAGWADDQPIWTGSCPCQPFSGAGAGEGFDDERHLWPAFHRLIRERRPPVVAGEQVASADAEPWVDLVQADLEDDAYAFGAVPFPAASIGGPHIRDRLYWMALAEHGGRSAGEPARRGSGAALPSGAADELADATSLRRPRGDSGEPSGAGREAQGGGELARRRIAAAAERDHADVLADASLGEWASGSRGDRGQASALLEVRSDADGRSARGQLGIAAGTRPQGLAHGRGDVPGPRRPAVERAGGEPPRRLEERRDWSRPLDGFWRDADWLRCRDGLWRPVEPGSQPLVDGLSFRVGSGSAFEGKHRQGMLKAYGNAIVVPQAIAFIQAVMDILEETRP